MPPKTAGDRLPDAEIRVADFDVRLIEEWVGEFDYQPVKCKKTHRIVVVRKHLRRIDGRHRPERLGDRGFSLGEPRPGSAPGTPPIPAVLRDPSPDIQGSVIDGVVGSSVGSQVERQIITEAVLQALEALEGIGGRDQSRDS